jgi:hypothetical protein
MNAIKSKGSFGSQVRSIDQPYVIPVVKFAPMRLDLPIIDSHTATLAATKFYACGFELEGGCLLFVKTPDGFALGDLAGI